ncbi:hypothetical protein KIPB_012228, partial [Kipferlia bialata]
VRGSAPVPAESVAAQSQSQSQSQSLVSGTVNSGTASSGVGEHVGCSSTRDGAEARETKRGREGEADAEAEADREEEGEGEGGGEGEGEAEGEADRDVEAETDVTMEAPEADEEEELQPEESSSATDGFDSDLNTTIDPSEADGPTARSEARVQPVERVGVQRDREPTEDRVSDSKTERLETADDMTFASIGKAAAATPLVTAGTKPRQAQTESQVQRTGRVLKTRYIKKNLDTGRYASPPRYGPTAGSPNTTPDGTGEVLEEEEMEEFGLSDGIGSEEDGESLILTKSNTDLLQVEISRRVLQAKEKMLALGFAHWFMRTYEKRTRGKKRATSAEDPTVDLKTLSWDLALYLRQKISASTYPAVSLLKRIFDLATRGTDGVVVGDTLSVILGHVGRDEVVSETKKSRDSILKERRAEIDMLLGLFYQGSKGRESPLEAFVWTSLVTARECLIVETETVERVVLSFNGKNRRGPETGGEAS